MAGEQLPEVPGFRLECEVGRGATGIVYKARESASGRVVAIKYLVPRGTDRERWIRRYQEEIRRLEDLSRQPHENLVLFLGHHEDLSRNGFCTVLEFVDGPSLAQVLKKGPLPVPEALGTLRQIASGVGHLHGLGFVHRDLKPHNILRCPEGRWKVSDYGLAREWAPPDPLNPLAAEDQGAGTPDYIAPELLQRRGEPGPRTDVYSLGAVLFESLTGSPPRAVAGGIGRLLPQSPDGLADLAAWMLNAEPDRRCPAADRVVRAIDELSAGTRPMFVPGGGGVATRPTPGPSPSSNSKRAPAGPVRPKGPAGGREPRRIESAGSPDTGSPDIGRGDGEARAGAWIVWLVVCSIVLACVVVLHALLS